MKFKRLLPKRKKLSFLDYVALGPISETMSQITDEDEKWRSMAALSRSCKQLNGLFSLPLANAKQRKLKALLECVIKSDEEGTKFILDKHTGLLLAPYTASIKVSGYADRTFAGMSPWGVAIREGDVSMLRMMQPYLVRLDNGIERALTQFNEEYTETNERKDNSLSFANLVGAISDDVLFNGKVNSTTDIALRCFRQAAKKNNSTCFDSASFIKAYKVCKMNVAHWNSEQIDLFFCQVIGYLQRYVPTHLAKIFSYGFATTVHNTLLKRNNFSQSLMLEDGHPYFPLDTDIKNRLGFHHGIYIAQGKRGEIADFWSWGDDCWLITDLFKSQKTALKSFREELEKMLARHQQKPCLIM